MTNSDFREALKNGNTSVIFTDIDGKEYTHTILKAGKKQVTLYNTFLERNYKINFTTHLKDSDLKQYKIVENQDLKNRIAKLPANEICNLLKFGETDYSFGMVGETRAMLNNIILEKILDGEIDEINIIIIESGL